MLKWHNGLLKHGFRCSGLFPVREGRKLIQNFLQSLEPPFLVGGCCVSPVHMRAVRFPNLGYFFPKFLDTLRHQSQHKHSLNEIMKSGCSCQ